MRERQRYVRIITVLAALKISQDDRICSCQIAVILNRLDGAGLQGDLLLREFSYVYVDFEQYSDIMVPLHRKGVVA